MRVFVTGGTGAIGGYAVPALIAAGHSVTALARTDSKAALLRGQGATPVEVSLFDRPTLAEVFVGHDAVVNLASALPAMGSAIRRSAWRECEQVRAAGSAAIVEAALTADVGRLVQESVTMIYADSGAEWITENSPVERYPMAQGNHAAEANARRFAGAGADATVLRFGLFYGPGATHSEQFLNLARHRVGFAPGRLDSYTSSIHLLDAAAAIVAALSCPGGTYNIADDQPVTKRQYAAACADAVGTRTWVKLPGRLGLLLGDRLTSMTRSLRVSNNCFRAATDWRPRYPSVRDGYRAMACIPSMPPHTGPPTNGDPQ